MTISLMSEGENDMTDMNKKMMALNAQLQELGSAAIGFSAGVDSSFLAAAAQRVLGDRAVAVTACSATLPERERREATEIAAQIGIRHVFLDIDEMDSPDFVEPMALIVAIIAKRPASPVWFVGRRNKAISGYSMALTPMTSATTVRALKAVAELTGVCSPLLAVGLTKAEIREQSRVWGLPTWDKPSAACLSSRVAYGLPVTRERLGQIERAEEIVREYCRDQVRVRHHDKLARIEVSAEDIPRLAEPVNAARVVAALKEIGFTFVTLDLAGYRTGSLNETLGK